MSKEFSKPLTADNSGYIFRSLPAETRSYVASYLDPKSLFNLSTACRSTLEDWDVEYHLRNWRLQIFFYIKKLEAELNKPFESRKKEIHQGFVKVMISLLHEMTLHDYKEWSQHLDSSPDDLIAGLRRLKMLLIYEKYTELTKYAEYNGFSQSAKIVLATFYFVSVLCLTVAIPSLCVISWPVGLVAIVAVLLTTIVLLVGTSIIDSKNERDIQAEYGLLQSRIDVVEHHIDKMLLCQFDKEAKKELEDLKTKYTTNAELLTTKERSRLSELEDLEKCKRLENDRDQIIKLLKAKFLKTNSTGIKHILSEINESKGQISASRLFVLIKVTCNHRANRSSNKIKLFFSAGGRSAAAQTFYDAGKDKDFDNPKTRSEFITMLEGINNKPKPKPDDSRQSGSISPSNRYGT